MHNRGPDQTSLLPSALTELAKALARQAARDALNTAKEDSTDAGHHHEDAPEKPAS